MIGYNCLKDKLGSSPKSPSNLLFSYLHLRCPSHRPGLKDTQDLSSNKAEGDTLNNATASHQSTSNQLCRYGHRRLIDALTTRTRHTDLTRSMFHLMPWSVFFLGTSFASYTIRGSKRLPFNSLIQTPKKNQPNLKPPESVGDNRTRPTSPLRLSTHGCRNHTYQPLARVRT
jgi:hypothetical protein